MKVRRTGDDASKEFLRKAIHALGGVIIVFLVHAGVLSAALLGLLTLATGALVLFNVRYPREVLTRVLSMNRSDARIPGLEVLSYFVGCWIVLALFERHLALAAIMVLAFGDPLAHLISTGFGGAQAVVTERSYIYGAIGGTLVGALAAWAFVPILAGLAASAAAMVVEAGEVRIADHHLDDNLTIPIVAGIVLWVISLAVTI